MTGMSGTMSPNSRSRLGSGSVASSGNVIASSLGVAAPHESSSAEVPHTMLSPSLRAPDDVVAVGGRAPHDVVAIGGAPHDVVAVGAAAVGAPDDVVAVGGACPRRCCRRRRRCPRRCCRHRCVPQTMLSPQSPPPQAVPHTMLSPSAAERLGRTPDHAVRPRRWPSA